MNQEQNQDRRAESGSARKSRLFKPQWGLAVILIGSALLYFRLYDPSRFGAYHDDAIYVTTAKALASGEGYRIVSLPYQPAATKYPPLYPFLLSLVWRVDPHFPGNVNGMVALTAAITLLFLAITWLYLVKENYATNWQALVVVAATAVNWRIVIYATGIYSEMIYAALSVGALVMAERLDLKRKNWLMGSVLGVLIGLAFLARSTGVALLVAVAVYFIMQRKIRQILLPLAIAGLFIAGWFIWCHMNRTAFTGVNVAYYTNYLEHFRNVLHDIQVNTDSSMAMTILGVLLRNLMMVVVVSIPVLCLGLDFAWVVYLGFVLMFVAAGFIRDVARRWRLLHVYTVCYLGLHVVWLPFVSYDRYLAPILPFLLLWLVRELDTMTSVAKRTLVSKDPLTAKAGASVIAVAVVVLVSVAIYSYGSSVYFSVVSASSDKRVKPSVEDAEAIEWINTNSDPSDVLVCGRDPMYYLYTGRKAACSLPQTGTIYWQDKHELIFNIADESDGKYLVLTAADFEQGYQPDLQNQSFKELIEGHRERFVPVFRSSNGKSTIFQIETADGRR